MNKDIFKGHWKEFKGKIKEQWGKLTDDEITQLEGKAEGLAGLLQKRYGYTKDRAEKDIEAFAKQCERREQERRH